MSRRKEATGRPLDRENFMTIRKAVPFTGLSEKFLRQKVDAGTIPFITAGNRKLICPARVLEVMHQEARLNCENRGSHNDG